MTNLNPRIAERIAYLKRLLSIYIRFDKRYSTFDITIVDSTDKKCYVKIEFYKSVEVKDAYGVVCRYDNIKSGIFTIASLTRLTNVYRNAVNKLFKNRKNKISYDEYELV